MRMHWKADGGNRDKLDRQKHEEKNTINRKMVRGRNKNGGIERERVRERVRERERA